MNNDRETMWLIELQCDGGCKWFSRVNGRVWTRDANKALRFRRREDADEFLMRWNSRVDAQPLVGASVTEHAWIDRAAATAQEPVPVDRGELERRIAKIIHDAADRDGNIWGSTMAAAHRIVAILPAQAPAQGDEKLVEPVALRPYSEWDFDEDGAVLWYRTPIEEPPYVGWEGDSGWPFAEDKTETLMWLPLPEVSYETVAEGKAEVVKANPRACAMCQEDPCECIYDPEDDPIEDKPDDWGDDVERKEPTITADFDTPQLRAMRLARRQIESLVCATPGEQAIRASAMEIFGRMARSF